MDCALSSVSRIASVVPMSGFAAPARTATPRPTRAISVVGPATNLACAPVSLNTSCGTTPASNGLPPVACLISSGVVPKKNVSLWPVARSKRGPSSRIGPVIPPPARIVSSAACMSTFDNEVSAKASIEAKVKEDICMIVPGLNVLPYALRRCLARGQHTNPSALRLRCDVSRMRCSAKLKGVHARLRGL